MQHRWLEHDRVHFTTARLDLRKIWDGIFFTVAATKPSAPTFLSMIFKLDLEHRS